MKKKKVLAIFLAATTLASCGKAPEETAEETTKETTVATTTTAEETTAQTTAAPTATPTPRPTSAPTPTPAPAVTADPMDADEDQYGVFMAQIDAIEAEYPGSVYSISRSYGSDDHWILVSVFDNVERRYVISGGVIEMVSEESIEDAEPFGLSYDTIKCLPFLLETDEYNFGLRFEGAADTLDDGRYFGSVLGVSTDGTRLLLLIGSPMVLDSSFVESLNEGDSIGYSDFTGDITVSRIVTEDTNTYYYLSNGCFLSHDYCESDDTYMVSGDSDCPYVGSAMLVEVPVSSSCEVTDTYDMLCGMDEGYDPDAPSDNPITGSYWWYLGTGDIEYIQFTYRSNGWYGGTGHAFPVVIRNNEVVSINIEWR